MFEIRWSQGEKQSRIYQKVGFLVNPEGPSIPGSSLSAVLGLTWSRMGLLLQPKGLSCREEFAPQDGRFPVTAAGGRSRGDEGIPSFGVRDVKAQVV